MTKTRLLNLWKTFSNQKKPHGYITITILSFIIYGLMNYFLYPKPVHIDFIVDSLKDGKKVSVVLNEFTTYSREYFVKVADKNYQWTLYLRDITEVEAKLKPYDVKLSKDPITFAEKMKITRFIDAFLYFIYCMIAMSIYKIYKHMQVESKNLLLEKPNVKFSQVAGIGHILNEVKDAVAHFQNSDKLTAMGGKAMKGMIFHGPPGTGKTLMAKAVAGEMKSNFIAASGSQFIEMYVGVGAKRMRELFEVARKNTPCILFIDEIDAFAQKRGSNRTNSEYDQTVNEFLAQMDGFKDNRGILVIAATNNLDSMDEALIRPGRFDRKIKVEVPTFEGRKEILDLYITKNKSMDNIDIPALARQTTGWSGADLNNLVDRSISEAVSAGRDKITMGDFAEAKTKISLGSVNNIRLSDQSKIDTAYHEVGHALVAKLIKGPKVEHISIMPRGQSLGQTLFSHEEKYSHSTEDITNQIKIALGGRVAEKMSTQTESTGASQDLRQATALARSLVCQYGMSKFGPINMDFGSSDYMSLSEYTKQSLDEQTFAILRDMEKEVVALLEKHKDEVKFWADKLVEKENIDSAEFYGS